MSLLNGSFSGRMKAMKTLVSVISAVFFLLCVGSAQAAPKRIVVIRHCDYLPQKNYGPALSPRGQVRAEKFVGYYLKRFGTPDFIFATHPLNRLQVNPRDKNAANKLSLRELQTLAPLANQITKTTNKVFPVLHPYSAEQYDKLCAVLLKDPKYKGKDIIVCWDHYKIPQILKALGVAEPGPRPPDDVFDDVYVVHYNPDGSVRNMEVLKNQYPVEDPGSWEALYRCSSACGKAHSSP